MKFAKSTKLIVLTAGILFILQLLVSAKLAVLGKNIADLEEKSEKIKLENRILEQKIASASSLSQIKTEANKIGLKNKSDVLFVGDSYYMVAK